MKWLKLETHHSFAKKTLLLMHLYVFSVNLIELDLVILIIFFDEYRLLSFSLCICLYRVLSFSLRFRHSPQHPVLAQEGFPYWYIQSFIQ